MTEHLTSLDQANLLAGHAVAYATAFLDGRNNSWQLLDNAEALQHQLLLARHDAGSSELLALASWLSP